MRIEYVNKITGKGGFREMPRKFNLIRIGHHPDNHLVLDSPYVGNETGVIEYDVAVGAGWRFWNRSGKVIRVGDVVLSERDQYTLLRGRRVVIECWPYLLTASFERAEVESAADETERRERACADVVGAIHRELVTLHQHDPAERSEWLKDTYIHALEQQIQELAGQRPELPPDDMTQTELGDHLAAVAIRSTLLGRVVAQSGMTAETFRDEQEAVAWGRLRTALPDLESDLTRLAGQAYAALALEKLEDLSQQMRRLGEGFWSWWREQMQGRKPPSTRVRRYLAVRRLSKEIKDLWYGFGPLEDLLEDPTITEVMVIDADHIFIEKSGQIEDSGRRFFTDPLTIVQRIVARANRQINTSQPMADARMPDGSRVNAVIPPLALRGPCLTIRRFPRQRLTIELLIERYKALSRSASAFLRAAVINRRNIIVAGGTGTGKTTLLNCLSGFIPDKERIVTIEDTAELQLQKEHVVTLQGRQSNQEGTGQVTIRDLVRNSLRMRPDRIVVGECRGGEAIDMLQAMNTGHDGSMTTVHANSPEGVIGRLEVIVQQNADTKLPVESIHRQIVSAVDLIVQLSVVSVGGVKRKVVTQVAEVLGDEEGGVRIIPIFLRRQDGAELMPTGHLPSFLPDLIAAGLVRDPVDFVRGVED
jgi:Flp pilus assembly CpaF family ATPase